MIYHHCLLNSLPIVYYFISAVMKIDWCCGGECATQLNGDGIHTTGQKESVVAICVLALVKTYDGQSMLLFSLLL